MRPLVSGRVVLTVLSLVWCGVARADSPSMPSESEQDASSHSLVAPLKAPAGTASAIESWIKRVEFHGYVRQETAYRVSGTSEFTKIRQSILLTQSSRLTDELRVKATERASYDTIFDWTDTYPETVRSDQRWDVELRDTYLDYSHGPFDIRLGKQQIVWGDAVGLFFADVVNAKDLREYILPDFDLIRIPQWALDVEASSGQGHAEFVWLPVRDFHRLGVSGSEFAFPLPVPAGTSAVTLTDPSKPPASFSNSEAGLRLSYLLDGWDTSVFYFYTWDKFPVPYRTISGGVYNFLPQYQRANLLGGSFSKAIQDVVLKGELLINPHAALATLDTTDSDGIVQRTVVDYLIGLDYTLFHTIDLNVQLLQRIIANHTTLLANQDTTRTHLSIWLKTSLFGGKLGPELLFITRFAEQDWLLRPKLTYKLTKNLQWRCGADIFRGNPSGLFGQFNKHSRLYTELTYYF